ncbi:MAG: LamG-like jellyroll fold domain-containing protein [Pirellulales bacterium]
MRQLADVFERLGNSQAATVERERGAALEHPAAWEQVERSRRARAEGHLIEAIAAADQACELAPQMLPAAVEAVQARLSQTPPEENEAAMRRLANLPPTDAEAMKAFLAIHEALAPPDKKPAGPSLFDPDATARQAESWRAVTTYRENVGPAAFIAWSHALHGSEQDPLPASREAVRRNPENAATLRLHALHLAQMNGDPAETIRTAEKAMALDPKADRNGMEMIVAVATARAGDPEGARKLFRDGMTDLSYPLRTLGWHQHFAHAYGKVDEVAADWPLIAAAHKQNDAVEVCERLLTATAPPPDRPRIELRRGLLAAEGREHYWWIGHVYQGSMRAGFLLDPEERLARWADKWPEYHRMWMLIALAAMQRGDLELAQTAADRSTEILLDGHRGNVDSAMTSEMVRGLTYLSSGDVAQARSILAPLCRANQTENCFNTWSWAWTGGYQGDYVRALIDLGELDEAERRCNAQAQLRPEDANIQWAGGLLELARQRASASLPHFARAAQIDPLNASIELDWARALVAANDPKSALPHLQTAVQRAEGGQLRGFRLVAAEAAELALRIADDGSLDDATRRIARGKAYLWFRDHLTRWTERVRDGADDELAAVAQQLPKLLVCPAAARLREDSFRNSLSAPHRAAWDELWSRAETTASEAAARYAAMPKDRLQQMATRSKVDEAEAAQTILSQGGSVTIATLNKIWLEQLVTRASALPQGVYRITAVSYRDCSIADQDLALLEKLPYLKHVFLDRTNVTDAGVRRFVKRAYALRTLTLNGTQVTQELLPSLSPIETVSLRDVSIESAAMEAFSQAHPQVVLLPRLGTKRPPRPQSADSVQPSFAMWFDGESRVNLPLKRNANDPATIEAWVQLPAEIYSSYGYVVVGSGISAAGKSRMLGVNLHDSSLFRGESRDANGANTFTPPGNRVARERWMHLAVVFNEKELRFHANGELAGTKSLELPADNTSLNFSIGAVGAGLTFFGLIDEVRISSIARYDGQFVPQRRFEPDEHTLALYHFDEGSGEIVHDSSGHGHDGKVNGSPKWIPEAETEE